MLPFQEFILPYTPFTPLLTLPRFIASKAPLKQASVDYGLLMLGTILIDTRNLKPSKTSPRDAAAIEYLLEHTTHDQATLYDALQKGRFDVGHLSAQDLLGLDYKTIRLDIGVSIAICGIMCGISEYFSKCEGKFEAIGRAFAEEHAFDLVLLMTRKEEDRVSKKMRKGLVCMATGSTEGEILRDRLFSEIEKVPGNLSSQCRANPLFQSQNVVSKGFAKGKSTCEELDNAFAVSLRGAITRKTLMPFVQDVVTL